MSTCCRGKSFLCVISLLSLFLLTTSSCAIPYHVDKYRPEESSRIIQTYPHEQMGHFFMGIDEKYDIVDNHWIVDSILSNQKNSNVFTDIEYVIDDSSKEGRYLLRDTRISEDQIKYWLSPEKGMTHVENVHVFSYSDYNLGSIISIPANCYLIKETNIEKIPMPDNVYYGGKMRAGIDIPYGDYFYILDDRYSSFRIISTNDIANQSFLNNANFGYLTVLETMEYINISSYILVPVKDKPEFHYSEILPCGMYKVGVDIPSGVYQVNIIEKPVGFQSAGISDYYDYSYIISDLPLQNYSLAELLEMKENIMWRWKSDKSEKIQMEATVTLEDGQYISLVNCELN